MYNVILEKILLLTILTLVIGPIEEQSDNLVNAVVCCQLHLFDVDIPGGITFKESDAITPGEEFCVVDTGECL